MIAPLPQHLEALNHANEVRIKRCAIRRAVRDGEMTVAEVILSNPPEVARMTITELLTAQRRWGPDRSRRFLWTTAIPETKALGSLTDRQRNLLVGML